MTRSWITETARIAGLALIASGGLLGTIENGILEDLLPAAAAAFLFLIALATGPRLATPPSFWWLLALVGLSAAIPGDLRETVSLAGAAIAFLAGANLRDDDNARRVVLGAALLLGLLALYQRFVLFPELAPLLQGEARNRLASGRVFSSFILPAQYAAYGAMVLPLAWAASRTDRHRKAATAILVLGAVTLVMTGALSGLVAAAAGLVYLFGPGRRAVTTVTLILALGAGVFVARPDLTFEWRPVTMRLSTWRDALGGMADAPILGHGTGSFERLYLERYYSPDADEVKHPHSWPVKVGFEHGAVGLAAFLLAWSALLVPPRDRSWRAAAIAFAVAMLLDVADHAATLRAFGLFALGASLPRRRG